MDECSHLPAGHGEARQDRSNDEETAEYHCHPTPPQGTDRGACAVVIEITERFLRLGSIGERNWRGFGSDYAACRLCAGGQGSRVGTAVFADKNHETAWDVVVSQRGEDGAARSPQRPADLREGEASGQAEAWPRH